MMKLIAAKSMTYATRRLAAGDLFTATPRDARLLVALKRAREVPSEQAETSEPPPNAKPTAKPKNTRKRAAKTQPRAS